MTVTPSPAGTASSGLGSQPGRSTRRSGGSRWRFGPKLRKAILAVHVATSVALIGNTASVIVIAIRAGTSDAADAQPLYQSGLELAFVLAIPLTFASLITGLALGLGTRWGLLRYYWVVTKLALLVAVILTGSLAVGPWLRHLADASGNGLEHEALGAERWQVTLAGAANLVFVIAAVCLAVFKPWGHLPWVSDQPKKIPVGTAAAITNSATTHKEKNMAKQNENIRTFIQQWTAAESAGDRAALAPLLTDDFVGVGPMGFALNKEAWLGRYEPGGLKYDDFALEEVQIHEHGDSAVVVARLDQPGTFQGHPTPEAARATLLVADRPKGKQLAAISLTFMAGTKGAPTMPGRA